MQVDMVHRLPGLIPAVDYQPIAPFGNSFFCGQAVGRGKQLSEKGIIGLLDIADRGNVAFWYNQQVNGRYRVDVPEGEYFFVFIDDI